MDEMCLGTPSQGYEAAPFFHHLYTRHYLRSCPKMTYFGDEMVSLALRVDVSKKETQGYHS